MRSIEIRARTVSEAVEQALEKLNKDRDEVLIEVISQDTEEALVRVSALEEEEDLPLELEAPLEQQTEAQAPASATAALARRLLEQILQHMDIPAFVTPVHTTVRGPNDEPEETLTLHVEGTDEESTGLLIGRRGETLHSLQYLLNLIVSRRTGKWPQIVIDVGNYRQRRKESLEGLARRIADRVRQTGHPLPLEPMSAFDRRIVHLALRDDPTVYTESSGEGEARKVVIYPAKGRG